MLLFYQQALHRYSLAGSRQDPPVPLTSEHAEAAKSLTDVYTRRHSDRYPFPLARAWHMPRLVNSEILFALDFPEQVLKYLALRMSLNRAVVTRQK